MASRVAMSCLLHECGACARHELAERRGGPSPGQVEVQVAVNVTLVSPVSLNRVSRPRAAL